jgi:spore coat protein U-like protein
MTLGRSAIVALLAGLLVATLPVAGAEEQYPRGLMSATPTAPQGGRTCTIDVRPLSFGTYDSLSGIALDALAQVIYVCGNLDDRASGNKTIRIEMETGYSNQYGTRNMTAGNNNYLEYNIYLDPTHRTIWGNGTNGTDAYIDPHPPNKTPVTVPVFGRIHAMQDVPAGTYVDSLIVRIVF